MTPHQTATIATVWAITLTHGWLMLFHKTKMGTDSGDKPKDRSWLGWGTIEVGFALLTGMMGCLAYRRTQIALENWNPQNWFEHLTSFLPLPANTATLTVGAIIFATGTAFRMWSIHVLGRFFTFQIGIRDSHKIVEDGPYKYLRHPSYTGYLLMILGAGFAYASLFLLAGAIPIAMAFFRMRMNDEETMLVKHFGTAYAAYMKRTHRLVPFLY